MSNILEKKWKTALTSILEELDKSEYNKMLFCYCFDKIPKSVKTGTSREEMPQIIIQHLGVDESISAIKDTMEWIPRKDSTIQDLLRPFVDKLRNKHEEENRGEFTHLLVVYVRPPQTPAMSVHRGFYGQCIVCETGGSSTDQGFCRFTKLRLRL